MGPGATGKHIVVFSPNQIKSADGNSGAFNSKSNSITAAEQVYVPWVGVDLDATLAMDYEGEFDPLKIGAPIPTMVEKVKSAIAAGATVKIFTARMADKENADAIRKAIGDWTEEHVGTRLDATNEKDPGCTMIVDNIARQAIADTGIVVQAATTAPARMTHGALPSFGEFLEDIGGFNNLLSGLGDADRHYEEESRYSVDEFDDMSPEEQEEIVTSRAYSDLEGRYYDAVVNHERSTFPRDLYRAVTLKGGIDGLKTQGVGIYWAFDENRADAHWGEFGVGYQKYILRAKVPETVVDWRRTILANIDPSTGDDEAEVTLIPGSRFELTGWKIQGPRSEWQMPTPKQRSVTAAIRPEEERGTRIAGSSSTAWPLPHDGDDRLRHAVPDLKFAPYDWSSGKPPYYDPKTKTIHGADESGEFTKGHEIGHALTHGHTQPPMWHTAIEQTPGAKEELGKYKWANAEFGRWWDDDRSNPRNYDWVELQAHLLSDYVYGKLEPFPALRKAVETMAEWLPESPLARFVGHASTPKQASADIEIENDCYDSHGGETYCTIRPFNTERKVVGYIDYSLYDDEIHIKMVETADSYKRQGIATRMIEQLRKDNPGDALNWGMLTDDGAAFKAKVHRPEDEPKSWLLEQLEQARPEFAKSAQGTCDTYPLPEFNNTQGDGGLAELVAEDLEWCVAHETSGWATVRPEGDDYVLHCHDSRGCEATLRLPSSVFQEKVDGQWRKKEGVTITPDKFTIPGTKTAKMVCASCESGDCLRHESESTKEWKRLPEETSEQRQLKGILLTAGNDKTPPGSEDTIYPEDSNGWALHPSRRGDETPVDISKMVPGS
jgi:hypothetical protein